MNQRIGFFIMVFLLVSLSACAPSVGNSADCTAEANPEGVIGVLTKIDGTVKYGSNLEALQSLQGTQPFKSGDTIQLTEGGEGVLEYGEGEQLRLFNDTELSVSSAAKGPCLPLEAHITLDKGGFIGQGSGSGNEHDIKTPGGVDVKVRDAQFLVTYEPDSGITTVAKWGGSMLVSAGSSTISVLDGFYAEVYFRQAPSPQFRIPISLEDYENQAQSLKSPLKAVSKITGRVAQVATPTAVIPDSTVKGNTNPSKSDGADVMLGTVITGRIANPGDSVNYAFSGKAGDKILVRLVSPDQQITPIFVVIRSDGSWLCSRDTSMQGTQGICEPEADGIYTLLISDSDGSRTGDFSLSLQSILSPADSIPLVVGQKSSGKIKKVASTQAFTFSGKAGDHLHLRLLSEGGEIDPAFMLFDPGGSLLCEGNTPDELLEKDCDLDADGLYTLLVGDDTGTLVGSYQLYLQTTQNPEGAMTLNMGEPVKGRVEPGITYQAYTFDGQAGDYLLVRLISEGLKIHPSFSLYRPDGSRLCGGNSEGESIEKLCGLDASGAYTVMVGDYNGTLTGGYNLYIQSTLAPTGAVPMRLWQKAKDRVEPSIAYHVYTFEGKAGDRVLIRLEIKREAIDPIFALYRPDGSWLCDAYSLEDMVQKICDLDEDGVYKVFVGDYSGTFTGNYTLTLVPAN